MVRAVTITITGQVATPDAFKAIFKRIEELEKKYENNNASVANLTSSKVVVTGNTPFKIYVFTVTSVMSSGTYTIAFVKEAPNNEAGV